MNKLTGKQVRYLRGLGHKLKPVVMVGKNEIDQTLLAELETQLNAHELIKVRIQEGCMMDRKQVAAELADAAGAAIAQILGNTFLLYRPAEEPVIVLPKVKS